MTEMLLKAYISKWIRYNDRKFLYDAADDVEYICI